MVLRTIIAGLALWLMAAAQSGAHAQEPCRSQTSAGVAYTVCTFDLAASDLRLFWRKPDGTPYRTFTALAADLATRHTTLAFAINGGMFQQDFSPVGLYVESGATLRPLNTADAPAGSNPVPNFYKKPNGVFFIAGGKAGVMNADAYAKSKPKVDFATQSGPMLVIDGAIHPAFIVGSTDRKRRSGVGVCDGTHVFFVLAETVVNFNDFAHFFRDQLGCANALFLDGGGAPGLYDPGKGRYDPPGDGGYGPIIAVVRPPAA